MQQYNFFVLLHKQTICPLGIFPKHDMIKKVRLLISQAAFCPCKLTNPLPKTENFPPYAPNTKPYNYIHCRQNKSHFPPF